MKKSLTILIVFLMISMLPLTVSANPYDPSNPNSRVCVSPIIYLAVGIAIVVFILVIYLIYKIIKKSKVTQAYLSKMGAR